MTVQTNYAEIAGVPCFNILMGATGDLAACCDAFRAAILACDNSGLAHPQIIRSRIWARDGAFRRLASEMRPEMLKGDLRAASASFIAPERLAPGIDVLVDLVAVSSTAAKTVREYEPAIAPPMFVALDDLVFLSGNTDIAATFETQLANICAKIETSLNAAQAQHQDIRQVNAYVSQTVQPALALAAIEKCFPCPVELTSVAGYSAPEKLVEIEVTARRPAGVSR
jgi:enamine deaminase RidA (YjgF/YER057c/UK114 family)